jgi:hypothetical protein
VRKTHLLRHFVLKTIVLPRQARDKHRENSTQKERLLRVFAGADFEVMSINGYTTSRVSGGVTVTVTVTGSPIANGPEQRCGTSKRIYLIYCDDAIS